MTPAATPIQKPHRAQRIVVDISHAIVLVLSLLLIVYISYDTFENIPFLENHDYMTFQFWVCVVFLADFIIEFIFAPSKWKYFRSRWFFLFISIPYLNIVNLTNLHLQGEVLFFVRFVPLVRGAYSMAMVVGYLSHNRAASLMTQYVAILLSLVYILSLIFYYEEHGLNPNVRTFWDALYFSAMNCSTVGCYFSAVTPVGKVISVILPTAGMLMLPLFTVFITDRVKKYDQNGLSLAQLISSVDNAEKEQAQQEGPAPAVEPAPTPQTANSEDTAKK